VPLRHAGCGSGKQSRKHQRRRDGAKARSLHEYGDSGRGFWDEWSRRSKKYNEPDQERTWRSFRRNGIGIGTLFHHAKQAGWRGERTRRQSYNGGAENNGNCASDGNGAQAPERTAVLVRADTLTPESISWAWKNRFAFGKMAMIAGDPGLGKSTILVEVAALHSRGGYFPCGEGKAALCESVYLTAEDGLRDTLVPRLIAAEADMSKVHFLTGTKADGADDEAMFDITRDIPALRRVFEQNPEIKILVIDPLTAYLGSGTRAKENTDVRRVLTPLIKLIEDFGVLLLANNHLNKNGGKALYRILDSIAFVALGRTIHLVVADADTPENRKFICDKTNVGSKPLGLTYLIQKHWIRGEQGEEIETSRISWGTKHIDESADEALNPETGETTSTQLAADFLRLVLAKGRVAVHDIEGEARQAGLLGETQRISLSKPFRSACDFLHVQKTRDGFGPGAVHYWSLPEAQPPSSPDTIVAPIVASSNTRATMEDEGNHGENTIVAMGGRATMEKTPYLPSNTILALPEDEASMMASMDDHGAARSDTAPATPVIPDTEPAVNGMVADPRKDGIPIFLQTQNRDRLRRGTLVANGVAARVWIRTIRTPSTTH
jgi:hypothetical protein